MATGKKNKNREASWFGFKKIDPSDKYGMVGAVFDSVAGNYDLMNDLMSAGIHRVWKKTLIRMMRPSADKKLLDVAGGTGDVAFRYLGAGGGSVTVCDINAEMLKVGKSRAIDRGITRNIEWIEGNAEKLPFKNNIFDLYSISFGLRNVPNIDSAIEDAHRVLKPGGQFFCLEFSHVEDELLEKLYHGYSFNIIPLIGEIVAKDRESYRYLVESIRQFPKQHDLVERMKEAGFEKVGFKNLTGGIAAIHYGTKPA